MSARGAAIVLAVSALVAAPSATAQQTGSQRFFTERLLSDPDTSGAIKDLLRGGGFVHKRIVFEDLTGDDRDDAVVRVHSGGAAGIVALYVFSTAGDGDGLRAVFASESLQRASSRVRDGKVSYRYARYEPGDELCCPSRTFESRLQWKARQKRFVVRERVEITPAPG